MNHRTGFYALLTAILCLATYAAPAVRAESDEQASMEARQRFEPNGPGYGAPVVTAQFYGAASKKMADDNKNSGENSPPMVRDVPSLDKAGASASNKGSDDKSAWYKDVFKDIFKDFPKGKWKVPLIAGAVMGAGIGVAAGIMLGVLPGIGWAIGAAVGLSAFFRYLQS